MTFDPQSAPDKRRELFELLLKKKGLTSQKNGTIPIRSTGDPAYASFSQQRIFFLSELAPGEPNYNSPLAIRLHGPLDVAALEVSLQHVVRRHETLQSAFDFSDEHDLCVRFTHSDVQLQCVDLSCIEPSKRGSEETLAAALAATKPFDLQQGPVFRTLLVRLKHDEHLLLVTFHHIIFDGWSLGIFLREMSEIYNATCDRKPTSWAAPSIQYADYANWQRAQLQTPQIQQQLEYWKTRLDGVSRNLELATDRPRSALASTRGDLHTEFLPFELYQSISALCHRLDASLFMVMMTAFKVLLHRYTGQTDIAVGSPVANRHRTPTEQLIGCFVNTLVIRSDIRRSESFESLLMQVKSNVLDAFDHQDLPYDRLVSELKTEHDLSRTPLFQVMFDVQESSAQEFSLNGLTSEFEEIHPETENFDLTIHVRVVRKGVAVVWSYARDLFHAATIRQMQTHFRVLLESIIAEPSHPISQLTLLQSDERRALLTDFASSNRSDTEPTCIHEQFEEQARGRPDATAVVLDNKCLTFRELNRRANQLAHYLRKSGVEPDDIVAIRVERGLEMITAILATLKSGAAYLPVDPLYPKQRLDFMLNDARSRFLVTDSKNAITLADGSIQVIDLDAHWPQIASHEDGNLPRKGDPSNLAYVIYTSGSTGMPKGSLITHSNLNRLFSSLRAHYHFGSEDVWTAFHSMAFDFSVWEFWGALAFGGTLVIVGYDLSRSPKQFYQLIQRHRVTFVNQTPSAFFPLAQTAMSRSENLDSVKWFVFGGEALEIDRLNRWFERFGSRQPLLVNMYGITETTVHVTHQALASADCRDATRTIGKPISDLSVYTLDQQMAAAPTNAVAEMYVSGPGLSRGYLHRPSLTAEKFLPDPFTRVPGCRMYRTGDLAQRRPNGALSFVGRRDHQVKLRGFRIELGEIEAVLLSHPSVSAAAAVMHESDQGKKRIVGFVVRDNSISPKKADSSDDEKLANELQERCKKKLPSYMVPSSLRSIDSLPLTPSGKLARQALTGEDAGHPLASNLRRTPRTKLEETLCQIWSEALNVSEVSIDDNFFELGGDSIVSIQVVGRAKANNIQMTVQDVFQHPTIASLSEIVTTTSQTQESIRPEGTSPLTPIQHWFFDQHHPNPHHYNQSLFLKVRYSPTPSQLKDIMRCLVEHHDVFRSRYTEMASGWQAEYMNDVDAPVAWVDLSHLPARSHLECVQAVGTWMHANLNLQTGPLLRGVWLERGHQEPGWLLLVAHHAVVDGVSWRIIMDDLRLLLRNALEDDSTALPPKTTSYKKWAELLRETAGSPQLKPDRAYWSASAARPSAKLPVDFAESQNIYASARTIAAALDRESTQNLLTKVPEAFRSRIDEVLLAAVLLAFHRECNMDALRIDVEGHGREDWMRDADVTRTLGWFTTIYPVFFDLNQFDSPETALKSVKEQMRSVPGRGLAYSILRFLEDGLAVEFDQHRPQVSFNHLGRVDLQQNDSLMERISSSTGAEMSPKTKRTNLIDVSSVIIDGQLRTFWTFNEKIHKHHTVHRWSEQCIAALNEIIACCSSMDGPQYTPADFPAAKLDLQTVNSIVETHQELEDVLPLSAVQQGMLFHSLDRNRGEYLSQVIVSLHRRPCPLALEQSWQAIIQRHAALRSSVWAKSNTRPLQIISQRVSISLLHLDWREIPKADQERQLQRFLADDRQRGLDVSQPPLFRLTVVQCSETEFEMVWSHHHVLLDGWSVAIVLNDWMQSYEGICSGEDPTFSTPISHRDFVLWKQRRQFQGDQQYWQKVFRGFRGLASLSIERDEVSAGTLYKEHVASVSGPTRDQLHAFSRSQHLTLNTISVGAWCLLLSRYNDSSDVVTGITVAGRPADFEGVESMVGLYINTLPIRVQVEDDLEPTGWLSALQQQLSEAREHEHCALSDIQKWCDIPSGSVFFDTLFVFENYPVTGDLRQREGQLRVGAIRSNERTNYGLTLVMGSDFSIKVLYDAHRFEESAIRNLAAHLEHMLAELASRTNDSLVNLTYMKSDDIKTVTQDWNDTRTEFGSARLHSMFEQQAILTPDAIAVACGDECLSYRELNRRATAWSYQLMETGIQGEECVGILQDRSLDLVVSILAVLKAGGAYLPLDTSEPVQRLRHMLAESNTRTVITNADYVGRLTDSHVDVLLTGGFNASSSAPSKGTPRVSEKNLAYVIFTSGSTGAPKGVANTHEGIVNRIQWMQSDYHVMASDRVLQKTPYTFDVSLWEFFLPLSTGACLVLARPGGHTDVEYLSRIISLEQITMVHFVPSVFDVFLESMPSDCESLTKVFCSGEALTTPQTRLFFEKHKAELHNLYGPTEAAVDVTSYRCHPDGRSPIPIGQPVANTQILILDRQDRVVAAHVPGDLFIGGIQLARGYVNRPDLTAELFVPCSYVDDFGGRVYRTGDRARFLADGKIEYLGRSDGQVKLAGCRIELSEVETAIKQHASVNDAIVSVEDKGQKKMNLVAHVTSIESLSSLSLRRFLRQRLPDYMLPSQFVFHESFPLTKNGKIDRQAVFTTKPFATDSTNSFEQPQTPLERTIASVWSEVLGIDTVGRHDNFFDLGGHSLQLLEVVLKLQQQHGIQIGPRDVLLQTLGQLAKSYQATIDDVSLQDLI